MWDVGKDYVSELSWSGVMDPCNTTSDFSSLKKCWGLSFICESEIQQISEKKPSSIFLTSIKLSFDLWPLNQFTIFEEKPGKIEEKHCKCPSEEESIHFEEIL